MHQFLGDFPPGLVGFTQAAAAPAATSGGKVSQVIGAVVDVGGTQGGGWRKTMLLLEGQDC